MPTKTTKSRTSKTSTKKSGFKFRWWMGLGLVVLVALIGVLVVRFSHAGAVVLANPAGCPRVTLTQAHSKGAATSGLACLQTQRINYVQDVNISPGGIATYCAWGRYYGDAYVKLGVAGPGVPYTNGPHSGWEYHPASDAKVTGYGAQWNSTPNNAAPGGGSQLLACVRANSTNVRQIDYEVNTATNSLVLWDYITVSDIQ